MSGSDVRHLILSAAFFALATCKGQPARLVAGNADTVIVNNRRAVQLPIKVFDGAGHLLPDSGVRYRWIRGYPVSISSTGSVTCTQAGDAIVRASLGPVVTDAILRCRPIRELRATRMLNLVVGDSAQDLPFEAVGLDGQPVSLLAGNITVGDSTIVTLEGQRVRGRAPGSTELTMRFGDRQAFAAVHVYERALTPEGVRPGQHLAVGVRLGGGEMRHWRIPASVGLYFLAVLPDSDEESAPRLAVVGANCEAARVVASGYFCLAQHDATVTIYHPQNVDPAKVLRGTLAVWRQDP
ncbi:MAG: hypothetical protein ACR2NS_09020 [Gemmatimonadaceae bacterium]